MHYKQQEKKKITYCNEQTEKKSHRSHGRDQDGSLKSSSTANVKKVNNLGGFRDKAVKS